MKQLLTLFLLLFIHPALQAEIYRCTDSTGHSIYQNDPCPSSSQGSTVQIDEIDPNIVRYAEEKLDLELKAHAELEALAAQEALMRKEIEAIERNTRANEESAAAAREQADIQRQEQLDYYYDDDGYYAYPFYRYSTHRGRNGYRDYNDRHDLRDRNGHQDRDDRHRDQDSKKDNKQLGRFKTKNHDRKRSDNDTNQKIIKPRNWIVRSNKNKDTWLK